jgi:glyoxylase I family protein
MERVTGIGGVFRRARDPKALDAWYESRLGIAIGEATWAQEAGPTVFSAFQADSAYFPAEQQVMLNLRVADLAAMVAQLRALGEEVSEPETYDYGRFARLHDPEGFAIELWEPPAEG